MIKILTQTIIVLTFVTKVTDYLCSAVSVQNIPKQNSPIQNKVRKSMAMNEKTVLYKTVRKQSQVIIVLTSR